MASVHIKTAARLHFGLFAGDTGDRKFGGVGMMIDNPNFELDITPAKETSITGADADLESRIRRTLAILSEHVEFGPVQIAVHQAIPPHQGLGSGTQLALALAKGVATLRGLHPSLDDLVLWTGRGRRSAVGCYGFLHGGIVFEAGRKGRQQLAPMLKLKRMPDDWRIVCISTRKDAGLHGEQERRAFETGIRFDDRATDQLVRLAVLEMIPALGASDYLAFAESLFEFNRIVGRCFAPVQGGEYASLEIARVVAQLRELGFPAVGQSSWGSTVFAVVPTEKQARRLQAHLQEEYSESKVWIANDGAPAEVDARGVPSLLVSVRSVEEASIALKAGADLLDVKEPSRGSLGRPDVQTSIAVGMCRREDAPDSGFSVAIGELSEAEQAVDEINAIRGSGYRKVGFANERQRSDWKDRYFRLVARMRNPSIEVVPAAYADAGQANAPGWREILESIAAVQNNRIMLVDTFDKSHRLIDIVSRAELEELFARTRQLGVVLALAGSIRSEDLKRLPRLPEILAIRGAACKGGDRNGAIDQEAISEFRRAIVGVMWG